MFDCSARVLLLSPPPPRSGSQEQAEGSLHKQIPQPLTAYPSPSSGRLPRPGSTAHLEHEASYALAIWMPLHRCESRALCRCLQSSLGAGTPLPHCCWYSIAAAGKSALLHRITADEFSEEYTRAWPRSIYGGVPEELLRCSSSTLTLSPQPLQRSRQERQCCKMQMTRPRACT